MGQKTVKLNIQRRCPKCGGNLFLYNDYHGWYEQCLQCSLILYLDVVYEDKEKVDLGSAAEVKRNLVSNKGATN